MEPLRVVTPYQSNNHRHEREPITSMAHLVEPLASHLNEALVPAAAWTRIRSITSRFAPLSGAIFECRIDREPAETELSLRAKAGDGGREHLAGLSSETRVEPIWQRLSRFCVEWINPDSAISRHVENLWLEFDLEFDADTADGRLPLPCVFFDAAKGGGNDAGWITGSAIPILLGKRLPPATTRNLERYIRIEGTRVHYVGVMSARQTDAIRLNLVVETGRVLDHLAAIAPATSSATIRRIVEIAERFSSSVTLDLDLGETIQSTVGLEIKPDRSSDWPLLFMEMAKRGLCLDSKRRALLDWPGWAGGTPAAARTAHTSFLEGADPRQDSPISVRRLNHVKVVHYPDRPLQAKAYLYAGFGWLDDASHERAT